MPDANMQEPTTHPAAMTSRQGMPRPGGLSPAVRRRLLALAAVTGLLAIGFHRPLLDLVRYSLNSDLYSHILLIPCITAYLLWIKRDRLALDTPPVRALAVWPALGGVGALVVGGVAFRMGWQPVTDDYLAVMMPALLLLFLGGCFLTLSPATLRAAAFPLAFLIFVVPFPVFLNRGIEGFFQHTSADAAWLLLKLSGMPVFREGTSFQLPGFAFEVAPECSGIRSSLVLFIVSLLAGYLFLRSPIRRAVLTGFVIPLAILRNGFRVFTISQLCVHIGPEMIDSPIHRRGGPVFFILSLFPFFLVMYLLRRSETKSRPAAGPPSNPSIQDSP